MKFRENYQNSLTRTKRYFKDLGMRTEYLNINYPTIMFEVFNCNLNKYPGNYNTVANALSVTYSSSHRLCRILAGKIPMNDGLIISKPLLRISNERPVSIELSAEGRKFLGSVYDVFDIKEVDEDENRFDPFNGLMPEPSEETKKANRGKVTWLSRALGIKL